MPATSETATSHSSPRARHLLWIMVVFVALCTTLLLISATPSAAAARFIDIEAGWAFSGYNDVRIPGDGGTEFSLTDDLSTDPAPFIRLRIGRILGEKHYLSGLVAPLRLSATGVVERPIDFQGAQFPTGAHLDADYRFDSYRLTYRYRAWHSPPFQVWFGITAKIRDAEVAVRSDESFASLKNTGFVPLLSFSFEWQPTHQLSAVLEGDALAGGPGRAEDVFVGLGFAVHDRLTLKGGYRILEGGADVDESYNFALIHFISFGLILNL